jgi:hypothetical protein
MDRAKQPDEQPFFLFNRRFTGTNRIYSKTNNGREFLGSPEMYTFVVNSGSGSYFDFTLELADCPVFFGKMEYAEGHDPYCHVASV